MDSREPVAARPPWTRIEGWLIVVVATHSTAIGLGAVFAAEWGLRFGGFEAASSLFFPRQVGVFHVVVGCAYLIEWFRYRGVAILVTTKTIAVAFLGTMVVVDALPWIVPFSLLGDALMGAAVLFVHRLAAREARDPSDARASRP